MSHSFPVINSHNTTFLLDFSVHQPASTSAHAHARRQGPGVPVGRLGAVRPHRVLRCSFRGRVLPCSFRGRVLPCSFRDRVLRCSFPDNHVCVWYCPRKHDGECFFWWTPLRCRRSSRMAVGCIRHGFGSGENLIHNFGPNFQFFSNPPRCRKREPTRLPAEFGAVEEVPKIFKIQLKILARGEKIARYS
jgi:hypothetical protein